MTLIQGVLGGLAAFTAWFAFVFGTDVMKHKEKLEPETSFPISAGIGFVTNFFDTLGIGSFAPTTALLRGFRQIQDKVLPGTLNVSCTIPVVLEAFIFMTVIEVEPITLISLLAAATVGAYFGAKLVSGFPEKKVQIGMGIALLVTAALMTAGMLDIMPGGGDSIGLTGSKLAIGVMGNFVLGALMTIGIGLYAPCMALVYLLGMSPRVAFPIMMGSCAFLMPVASAKFVKEQAYNKKASLAITVGGVVGVYIAAYIVKSLPLDVLKMLVIGVMIYTAFTLFRQGLKKD